MDSLEIGVYYLPKNICYLLRANIQNTCWHTFPLITPYPKRKSFVLVSFWYDELIVNYIKVQSTQTSNIFNEKILWKYEEQNVCTSYHTPFSICLCMSNKWHLRAKNVILHKICTLNKYLYQIFRVLIEYILNNFTFSYISNFVCYKILYTYWCHRKPNRN